MSIEYILISMAFHIRHYSLWQLTEILT